MSLLNLRYALRNNPPTFVSVYLGIDDEPHYNKHCSKHRCNVCKHINTATNACINCRTIMLGNSSCDSAKLVCQTHCKKCPDIKETEGRFRCRFNSHTIKLKSFFLYDYISILKTTTSTISMFTSYYAILSTVNTKN